MHRHKDCALSIKVLNGISSIRYAANSDNLGATLLRSVVYDPHIEIGNPIALRYSQLLSILIMRHRTNMFTHMSALTQVSFAIFTAMGRRGTERI